MFMELVVHVLIVLLVFAVIGLIAICLPKGNYTHVETRDTTQEDTLKKMESMQRHEWYKNRWK